MLLIHNLNQLLDAFNNCSVGLFDFDDVIGSAQVPLEDVLEKLPDLPDGGGRYQLHSTAEYHLFAITVDPGTSATLTRSTDSEWLYVISGSIALGEQVIEEQSGVRLPPRTQASSALMCKSDQRCVALHLTVH